MIPIPGTKRIERLEENLGALDVTLTPEEIATISDGRSRSAPPPAPAIPKAG